MSQDEIIKLLRAHARQLRFESTSAGALALMRLKWGLPTSETIAGVPEVARAMECIHRTILHSHHVNHGTDQYGNGSWAMFSRHVSEGDQRWDFEVAVAVDRAGVAAITEVRIVRPGDDVADPDDPDAEPRELRAPLAESELLPAGMLACPCCGHATLSSRGQYQICPVCFWEDDGQDTADAEDERGAPNKVSLLRGRANFLSLGASCEADRAHVRKPTREEVVLRRFTAEGREA